MVQWLTATERTTARKLRLWVCACVRRAWHLLPDERGRASLEVAERFADGQANELERANAASHNPDDLQLEETENDLSHLSRYYAASSAFASAIAAANAS